MQVKVKIINAFVDGEQGGNPAGVVLDADALSTVQKQYIAANVGLSETAFVSRSSQADFKLDFFTPNRQIAHCGHATIATFSYLEQLGRIPQPETSKETIDGNRRISMRNGEPYMEQTKPSYRDVTDMNAGILASLGLDQADALPAAPFQVVDTGNNMLIVPLKNKAVLARIQPDFDAIRRISETLDLIGYYVFSQETMRPGRDATVRMFAPRYGISEESATGMGAGTLACYLHDTMGISKSRFQIEQGWFMNPPMPSILTVELAFDGKNNIAYLLAGGKGKVMSEKLIVVPE